MDVARSNGQPACASELGVAMNYLQPGQRFNATLRSSFADLVVPSTRLLQALIAAQTPDDEAKILGVSRVLVATALEQT